MSSACRIVDEATILHHFMCFKSIKHVQLIKSEVTVLGSVYGKLTVAEDTLQSFEFEIVGL
jgi:hypothetical protein